MNVHENGETYSFNIDHETSRSWKFITCFSNEKSVFGQWSGATTRAGDLLTIHVKNASHKKVDGTASPIGRDGMPHYLHCTVEHDSLAVISDAGVTVFD